MLSSLEAVKDALLTVTDNVGHYTAWDDSDKFIVWAEDSEVEHAVADNWKQGGTIEGTIDYFTRSEDDENIPLIPQALNNAGIYFELNTVQYEDDTRFIHYEWLFRVKQSYSNEPVSEPEEPAAEEENANDPIQGTG